MKLTHVKDVTPGTLYVISDDGDIRVGSTSLYLTVSNVSGHEQYITYPYGVNGFGTADDFYYDRIFPDKSRRNIGKQVRDAMYRPRVHGCIVWTHDEETLPTSYHTQDDVAPSQSSSEVGATSATE